MVHISSKPDTGYPGLSHGRRRRAWGGCAHLPLPDLDHAAALFHELIRSDNVGPLVQGEAVQAMAVLTVRVDEEVHRRLRHEIAGRQALELTEVVRERHNPRV